ncbi:MAG: helix-turn-helix domain-containing protein [bacterium]|nr:helix-turn-helix domain-containing protein [bacterium]
MRDVRQIIAENLIELRKVNKLTQLELAEKLNYSDKAISKWERGESLPDVEILCQIAELYGVTLDYLVTKDHEEATIEYKISKERANVNKTIITWLSVFSAVLLVVLSYILVLTIAKVNLWILYVWMIPLCSTLLLIFNCIWGNRKYRYIILSILMWSMLASFALQFMKYNIWLIFTLGAPGQVIILLIFQLGRIKTNSHKKLTKEENEKDSD